MTIYAQRRDKLRRLVKDVEADAILISDFTNVSYLTGFTGDDSYLLVLPKGEILITDFRYVEQLETECPDLKLHIRPTGVQMMPTVAELFASHKLKKPAVEGDTFTVGQLGALREALPAIDLVSTAGLVLQLREIKDKEEIDAIRKAIEVAERAFGVVKAMLRPELTEKQVADELDHQIRLFGGSGCSFTPIVGVGARGALPHGRPGPTRLEASPFVLIDWGARVGGYISDLTRVLTTSKIATKLERVYGVVLDANLAAIEAIRPGAVMEEVDAAARGVIHRAGFGKQFGHSLGHGIGMQVHEQPRLAVNQKRELKPGMVVTVEPGIYIPGWGGVRIEDDVLVTRTGCEVLSSVPKTLADCVIP